jgi:hypothetical protein
MAALTFRCVSTLSRLHRLSFAARPLVAILLMLLLQGCGDSGYSQKTPEDVLKTAKLMVERGEARKLGKLFYAENEDMRKVLSNFGVLLGNLQKLGFAVSENFPQEMGQLRERAEAAAKSGKASSLLNQIAAQASGNSGRSRRSNRDPEKARKEQIDREQQFSDSLNVLFADPYGFLTQNAQRLTTVSLTDDMAAILWDGQPVMAPMGMVMRRSSVDQQWYIVPPLNIPGIANYLPQSAQEYKVFGAMIAIINNVIVDLARDVRERKITQINELSRKAGEKAFLPAAMGYVAYGKMIEERRKKTQVPSTPAPARAPASAPAKAPANAQPSTPR